MGSLRNHIASAQAQGATRPAVSSRRLMVDLISEQLRPPVMRIQRGITTKDYASALAGIRQAERIGLRTPADRYFVSVLKRSVALGLKDDILYEEGAIQTFSSGYQSDVFNYKYELAESLAASSNRIGGTRRVMATLTKVAPYASDEVDKALDDFLTTSSRLAEAGQTSTSPNITSSGQCGAAATGGLWGFCTATETDDGVKRFRVYSPVFNASGSDSFKTQIKNSFEGYVSRRFGRPVMAACIMSFPNKEERQSLVDRLYGECVNSRISKNECHRVDYIPCK